MAQLMRILLTALATIFCVVACKATPAEHFMVEIATPHAEADYVCGLIQHYDYFRERGYSLDLPDHPIVDELLEKELLGPLDPQDCTKLRQAFEEDIYDVNDYRGAYRKVERVLPRVDQVYRVFMQYNELWGFQVHEMYRVQLTRYGPGGMFDAENGTIWLMITDAGSFKMHEDPSYVIIHEATHIGFDEPIVARYDLQQPALERLVDQFVVDHFDAILPEYPMQALGDRSIDPYLAQPDSWERLPEYIAEFVADS